VVAGRLAGVVVSARERRSQKGNKFAFAVFSEPTGQFEAIVFSDTLAQSRHLLEAGTAVIINVEGERGEGDTLKLRAQAIESLDAADQNVQKGVKVMLDGRVLNNTRGALDDLRQLLRPGGKSTVCFGIALSDAGQELEIALPGRFEVSPAQKSALQTVPGVIEVIDL
jgi:DNA polymerase-3 subunit alpha